MVTRINLHLYRMHFPSSSVHCFYFILSILTAIFPDEPGLASFVGAKDKGSGGDNWSYNT